MIFYVLISLISILSALPRFSVQEGTSCMSCHINPTGTGMRNDYGSNIYALEELSIEEWIKSGDEDWDGSISDNIQIGGEFRIQSFNGNSGNSTFPMQADIYGNIDINSNADIYFKFPIGSSSSNYEYYVLFNELPNQSWIKIGKSEPNYGLMVDDHTAFIKSGNRDPLLGSDNSDLDKGFRDIFDPYTKPIIIESGMMITDNIMFSSSISESGQNAMQIDNFTTSLNYIRKFNSFSLLVGNSIMIDNDIELFGFFGGVSKGPITFMFELDQANNLLADDNSSLASYAQFVYKPIQGLHLLAKYDYFDQNEILLDGSISRYSMGIEFYPLNLFELKLQARKYEIDNIDNDIKNEYLIQLHSWF